MERIQHSVEVDVPVTAAYDQWTQFEDFPRFMEGVERVQQIDDARLHWVASVGGVSREWDATIVRQEPDRAIAWDGFGGPDNAGMVEFEPLGTDRSRVTVTMDWEPEGAVEKLGDALGIVSGRIEGDLARFKTFIEERRVPTGAWRGRIPEDTAGGTTAGTTGTTGDLR
ncbi:MAG TPA: SRPBCC family protein [Actinomycetota bacterium]